MPVDRQTGQQDNKQSRQICHGLKGGPQRDQSSHSAIRPAPVVEIYTQHVAITHEQNM